MAPLSSIPAATQAHWSLAGPANLNVLTLSCCLMPTLSPTDHLLLWHGRVIFSQQTLQLLLQRERKWYTPRELSALKPESCFSIWAVIAGSSALPYKWDWGGGCFGWNWRGTGGTTSCKLEEALPDYDHCLHADHCQERSWKAQKPSPYLEKGPGGIIALLSLCRLPPVGFGLLCKCLDSHNAVMWIILSRHQEMDKPSV